MKLSPKQAEVIKNKSRFKVLNWGRRSGKTTAFAYEALGTALTKDNAHITYIAQTLGDARDIAWEIFIEVFGEAVVSTNQTLLEITVKNLKGGNSKVVLRGWESIYQSNKGRGTENDLLLCDEVAFCKMFMDYWDKVLMPTLLTSKGRAVFASTPNGFNDFYRLVQRAESAEDWWYSHATSYDNPANDPKDIERIKAETSEDAFAQEYLADFRRLEGLVYKEFDRNLHLYEGEPTREIINKLAGIDFGFTNPCAVVSILEDSDGHFWINDMWYKTGRTEEQIAEYVKSCAFNMVFPDPESPSAIEVMNRKGINVMEVVKGKDSVASGINAVRALFRQNRIHIHKDCTPLIWELENYAYPEKKPDHNEPEVPIKENDHALDALRYCLSNYKSNAISDAEYYMMLDAKRRGVNNYSR